MRVYAMLIRLALQDALQYRVESAIFCLYELLPPIMMMYVWLAVYQDQQTVAGFTVGEMLAYTMGVMLLRATVTVHVEWALDYEIRNGLLANALIRPYSYWAYLFIDSVGWRTVRQIVVVPVLLSCLYWLGPSLATVSLPPDRLLLFAVSVVLAYVVCFFMKLCIGLIGFWTNDIRGIATLYEVIASVLGGVLIPLALLPEWLQTIARLLPIQAIYGIPLAILLGRSEGANPLLGLALQLGWIVALWGVALVLWRAGLRQFESVGV